jgi:hypothetical protein
MPSHLLYRTIPEHDTSEHTSIPRLAMDLLVYWRKNNHNPRKNFKHIGCPRDDPHMVYMRGRTIQLFIPAYIYGTRKEWDLMLQHWSGVVLGWIVSVLTVHAFFLEDIDTTIEPTPY